MKANPFKFVLFLLIAGTLMFFLFRPFAYAIAMALAITLALLALYYLAQGVSSLFRKFKLRNTIEGIIEDKITLIQKQISSLSKDLQTIKAELQDIETQLKSQSLSNFASEKLVKLRDAFEVEEELKQEKLHFYQLTADKFEELLSDREVLKTISSKKEKLKEVRKDTVVSEHPTSEHLSSDKELIEELDFLTLRMKNTVHIDEAKDIHKELVSMYR